MDSLLIKEIEIDVARTFNFYKNEKQTLMNNDYFKEENNESIKKDLMNILFYWAKENPKISFRQGS